MKIRIADLNVEIFHHSPACFSLCRDFICDFEHADITVSVSAAEIEAEMANAKEHVTPAEAEFACIYRDIAKKLPQFDAFVLHGAAVECDGGAYVFSAPSGTGKSTHAALWLQRFGARARILNGDKPILRFVKDRLAVFGTPWCGKERLYQNACAPLHAICFLERAAENRIAPMQDAETLNHLYHQILMPDTKEGTERFLTLLDRMLQCTPVYLLQCNMHPEAAEVAYSGMRKENV